MKSKIIIYSMSILSLFLLGGCANRSEAQSLTALENQIKRVENVVTINGNDDISSVSPSTFDLSGYNAIQNHKANSYNNMTRENQLKQEVLSLNSTLKSCLQDNLKLGKAKANAIKKLTSNISENLSKYNDTKSVIKKNVKNINQNLKIPNINSLYAESEYIALNGNMSERYVYLCNIYDNLEQAYILICDCCPNNNSSQTAENNTPTTQSEVKESTSKISRFKKNIDSYAPSIKIAEKESEDSSSSEEKNTKDLRNIDTFNNYKPPVYSGYNGYNNPYNYGYNNMPINGYNNYGYNGYGFNNGYGYGLRRFNPNRNTDTFYPYNRNIDSYRVNPNLNYPVSGNPITEEEKNEIEAKENGVISLENQLDNTAQSLENTSALEEMKENVDNEVNDGKEYFDIIKQG